jgi:hypothetical protein
MPPFGIKISKNITDGSPEIFLAIFHIKDGGSGFRRVSSWKQVNDIILSNDGDPNKLVFSTEINEFGESDLDTLVKLWGEPK